jgi:hypothetical protein
MREGYVGQPRVSQIVGPNDGDKVPPYAGTEAAHVRHLGGMSHLLIAPSKWDTSMGALKLNIADARRFLGHNPAAVGQRSGASERVSADPVLANVHLLGTAVWGTPGRGRMHNLLRAS